ncbi:MAG: Tn3 family transposase [Propionivibrio sp.]|uniref:Tn3 family transposase n=1 Tax=Candidatus Propionivibrio dominans TaxID=2954373 RepID=A0A9D7IGB2_9RHOO|nr:Tn3 family transposase [Candidatus Propionivibrio dominans]
MLQRRLLLCLFGVGTNVGLKPSPASSRASLSTSCATSTAAMNKEALRAAVAEIVNGTFTSMRPPSGARPPRPVPPTPKVRAYD